MKMNTMIAMAILAWCEAVDAAALPQAPGLVLTAGTATSASVGPATANAAATAGLAVAKPLLPGLPPLSLPLPPAPASPVLPGAGIPGLPPLPAIPAPGLTVPPAAPVAVPPVPLAIPNLASALPKLPVVDGLPPLSIPTGLPKLPVVDGLPPVSLPTGLPKLPLPDLSLPLPPLSLPTLGDLPLPTVPKVPGPGDVPKVPTLPSVPLPPTLPPVTLPPTDSDSIDSYIKVGKIVLSNILSLLWKGAQAAKIPGFDLPSLSVPAAPAVNTTLPAVAVPLKKRQAVLSSVKPATATPAVGLPLLGGLTSGLTGGSSPLGAVTNTLGGVTGSLPVVGGLTSGLTGAAGGDPLGTVTNTVGGLTGSLPVVGGVTGGLTGSGGPLGAVSGVTGGLTGGSGPLGAIGGVAGTVANTAASLPVVGGVVAPVAGAVGGLTSGNPLGTVGGAVSGALGTVGGVAGSIPVVGGAAQGAVNTVGNAVNSVLPGPYPISQGVPGSDPVGGLSISIIATLLSLLKKDPLSLFGGLGGAGGLIKRDLPELADRHEIEKRQLAGLPSLSSGLPGVGVGGLPLSGVPGVSPDLAFLVGSIAKNIAVPGGKGLGSVTGNILGVLNGVVPNFLFKLPVVQDSVPTFGALQLLSSINPAKFGGLADLTNLAALSGAASGISAGDLAFIKTLPVSADPSNLITTITTLTDNILSLPGNVANLKAAVSVLCLKNLGLAVQGL